VLLGNGTAAVKEVAPGASGNVLTSDGPEWKSQAVSGTLGVGQTWQDVTSSRTSGTTYTNNTGKPIMVNVESDQGSDFSAVLRATISGVTFKIAEDSNSSGGTRCAGSVIVPNGATYSIVASGSGVSGFVQWVELR
jgi:hypothetical protein